MGDGVTEKVTEGRESLFSLRVKRFGMRRLMGCGDVLDGIVTIFSPFRPGLSYRCAKSIARLNHRIGLAEGKPS